jgi:signal transduction histidine kinase/ligand-binding sensor domain-containing protein
MLCAPSSSAQELPVRGFNVRDGLSQSRVNDIQRDRLGYVWFATWEGASRFDGRSFVQFGSHEGLPNPLVWCVAESPAGDLWLGTHGGGLARVAARGTSLESEAIGPSNPARHVYAIAFDRDGRMWLDASEGLYVSPLARPGALSFRRLDELGPEWFGRPFMDARGELWFVTPDELARTRGDELQRFPFASDDSAPVVGDVRAACARRGGGAWVAYVRKLFAVDLPSEGETQAVRHLQDFEVPPGTSLYDVAEDAAGRVWVATTSGLARIDGSETRWFGAPQGLPEDWIHAVEPGEGGLWIGTHQAGAAWLSDSGAELYSARSGLGDGHAVRLVPLGADGWLVTTEVAGVFALEHGRVRRIAGTDRPPFDRIQQNLAWDGAGWWVGTNAGIYRVRGPQFELERAEPVAGEAGLPPSATRVLGFDARGCVLIGTEDGRCFRGAPAGDRFEALPFAFEHLPRAFLALADGSEWFSDGEQLFRWRGGALAPIALWPEDGDFPRPRVLRADSLGGLWVGTRFGGLAHTADPSADEPQFERLTTRDGLASDVVFALAEEGPDALLIGTGRGIQRLRRSTRQLESLGVDGAPMEWINDLAFGASGELWAAAVNGVARVPLEPLAPRAALPSVRFTRCSVAGADLPLPAGGALEGPDIEVAAADSRITVEYVAVDPIHGQELLYQSRLEGLDPEWSQPERGLSAHFGQLAPGAYRLLVRAFDPVSGATSQPSVVRIDVEPPWWQHPLFIALVLVGSAALGWGAHRVHLGRQLALERMRTEIASDLHDDLGAGLARIAISSELSRRAPQGEAQSLMGEVAELARDLRGSMSELVWAIDPRNDSLADAALRMRRFASELLEGDGTSLDFRSAPQEELARQPLAPDRRRHLALWFKEAAVNAARHARAQRVEIDLELRPGRLWLSIRDDGQGFDPSQPRSGQGLRNLERRARELGGTLALESAPGKGTRVALDMPLQGSSWRSFLRGSSNGSERGPRA